MDTTESPAFFDHIPDVDGKPGPYVPGIFAIDGDTLRISIVGPNPARRHPTQFRSSPDDSSWLLVFRRAAPLTRRFGCMAIRRSCTSPTLTGSRFSCRTCGIAVASGRSATGIRREGTKRPVADSQVVSHLWPLMSRRLSLAAHV